jgi:hypothetical protein
MYFVDGKHLLAIQPIAHLARGHIDGWMIMIGPQSNDQFAQLWHTFSSSPCAHFSSSILEGYLHAFGPALLESTSTREWAPHGVLGKRRFNDGGFFGIDLEQSFMEERLAYNDLRGSQKKVGTFIPFHCGILGSIGVCEFLEGRMSHLRDFGGDFWQIKWAYGTGLLGRWWWRAFWFQAGKLVARLGGPRKWYFFLEIFSCWETELLYIYIIVVIPVQAANNSVRYILSALFFIFFIKPVLEMKKKRKQKKENRGDIEKVWMLPCESHCSF